MFNDFDLPVYFADFGKEFPVIWNNEPAVNGLLDTHTDVWNHGGGPGGEWKRNVLNIPYNAFMPDPKSA